MNRFYKLIFILTLLSSCSPKISKNISKNYPTLDYKQEIVVFGLNQSVPDNAEKLGTVKATDSGFTINCNYDIIINLLKQEARKVGGNAIKIIKHKPPTSMGSSCHRITVEVLKIEDIEKCVQANNVINEELLDVDYAILNVYRYSGMGSLVNYDLYLGDSVVCRVKNNFKTTIHIKKDGLNVLWAKTEKKVEVPINIKFGKTYYLRCSNVMGIFSAIPCLELIDSKTGKIEFEEFNAKHQ